MTQIHAESTQCDVCDGDLLSPTARNYGRCAACREATDRGMSVDEAREWITASRLEFSSAKINGELWWKTGVDLFVVAYPDLDALNREAPTAKALGYTIASMTAVDEHANLGRMAVGFWVAGPLGAAVAHKREGGAFVVAWEKR